MQKKEINIPFIKPNILSSSSYKYVPPSPIKNKKNDNMTASFIDNFATFKIIKYNPNNINGLMKNNNAM